MLRFEVVDSVIFARTESGRMYQMDKYELEGEDTWVPPTEAEIQILQKKRERSDKISQIMGQYLLSGYKMLDSVCESCGTILLQNRRSELYCVACSEVDNKPTNKDNSTPNAAKQETDEAETTLTANLTEAQPVDNELATMAANLSLPSADVAADLSSVDVATDDASKNSQSSEDEHESIRTKPSKSGAQLGPTWMIEPEQNLIRKIRSTAEKLTKSNCVADSIKYCALIKACSETLYAMRSLYEK